MKILVIGSNGQVGHELLLLGQNSIHDWLCLDRNKLDVTKIKDVDNIIDDFSPNIVINATAYTAVDKAETEMELATTVNRDAVRYLAQACERNKAVLMHISTDYVFSGNDTEPYKETDKVEPSGHYGVSKLAGECEVVNHCTKYIILRTSWVFGLHGNNFVKTMIGIAYQRDTINVVSDQYGAPTSAKGIANTLFNIAEQIDSGKEVWGIYHFSGYPYISWYKFAKIILNEAHKLQILPHKIKVNSITTIDYPTIANRPANSCLDCTKIKSTYGINPDDWRDQLQAFLETMKGK